MAQHRPTLLVFTLGEETESRRRRLLPADHGNLERRLHRACLDAALSAGRAADFQVEVCSPVHLELPRDVRRRRQRGVDFGDRVRRAIDAAFANGPEPGPVVLVGTDVPGLEAEHLEHTLAALEEDPQQVVVGPSPDGGFYLLAAARPLGAALDQVRWCCRQTLASLRQALEREGRSVVLLPPLADLDRRADLESWLAAGKARLEGPWRWLAARLVRLLDELRRRPRLTARPVLKAVPVRVTPVRGPPRSRRS